MFNKYLPSLVAVVALAGLAGCGIAGTEKKRHAMAQKEIDQCVAGFKKMMPDDAKRTKACECISDAMWEDMRHSGPQDEAYEEAHQKRIVDCGIAAIPGASRSDPFGILGDDDAGAALPKQSPTNPESSLKADDADWKFGDPMVEPS
jgi:hypothetical protein